ncbi:copper resistance protein CopC [Bacillus sp. ISL-47]|uniref:copper resistance CopC/CopD family protein n=1 Tax=Bacillus sp. ISL-47 TaxID=2819130 RepID=UPI001BE61A03|nr:copper resistance protein CopC [Bacillus sp. ISL-47]MBT2691287.1 copper resistance protein CopC [Bacillus sp. ISL-47]MBT2710555.1 copper resistance protein CopC [Pseudomonas sp. ISL-84]
MLHRYKIFILFVVVALQFMIQGNQTFAHSKLERTYPKEGEKIIQSPAAFEVWFQDPVVTYSDSIQILNATGKIQEMGAVSVDPEDKTHILTTFKDRLPNGNYLAKIKVIALDGFVINEEVRFTVSHQETVPSEKALEIIDFSPADGEILDTFPQRIDLWFNQPADITAIGLFDDLQQSVRLKKPYADPNNPSHIIVELEEELSSGTYQVTWHARQVDSKGQAQPDRLDVFYFAVNHFTPITQKNMGGPTISFGYHNLGLKQVGYWLFFIGITTLFGGTFFHTVVLKKTSTSRWNKVALLLLTFVLVGWTFIFTVQMQELHSLSFEQLLSIKFMWIPILQIILLIIGFYFHKIKLLVYFAALILSVFVIGHAPYPRYGGYITMAVNAIHLIAASIWSGGLFTLIVLPKKERIKEWLKDVLPVFSKWALISLIAIIATGFIMVTQYVPSFTVESFWKSEWGKSILLKIVLTFIVLLIGVFQWNSVKHITTKTVNVVITRAKVEIIYAVLILLFASFLVVSTPSAAEQGVYPSSIEKKYLGLNVDIAPFYPGLNELSLQFDKEDIKQVEVTLSMPPDYNVTYSAFYVGGGEFKLTGNLLHAAGTMSMNVKATLKSDEILELPFKIVVPGEMRLNE